MSRLSQIIAHLEKYPEIWARYEDCLECQVPLVPIKMRVFGHPGRVLVTSRSATGLWEKAGILDTLRIRRAVQMWLDHRYGLINHALMSEALPMKEWLEKRNNGEI